jgi:hypothetical protein
MVDLTTWPLEWVVDEARRARAELDAAETCLERFGEFSPIPEEYADTLAGAVALFGDELARREGVAQAALELARLAQDPPGQG